MSAIIFSEHAKSQILERKISGDEIASAIFSPDKVINQENNRFQAVKQLKRNGWKCLLIVIFRRTDNDTKVITAFLTTKFKKYSTK